MLVGDRVALITRLNLIEIVTVLHNARHSGGVARVRRGGGTGGDRSDGDGESGCCRGGRNCRRNRGSSLTPAVIRILANNAVRLSSLKVGAGHARVDLSELSVVPQTWRRRKGASPVAFRFAKQFIVWDSAEVASVEKTITCTPLPLGSTTLGVLS